MAYVPLSTRRSIRASKTDVPLPDYTKAPRPVHIVWQYNNDITLFEINRLVSRFKNKHLEGLTGLNGHIATTEVLTALLAYRKIPIKLLHSNIPEPLRLVVDNTMSNLVGSVYWKLPNNCYQMKTDYLQTISPSISITTNSKVY